MSTNFIITVDGTEQARRDTRAEAEQLAEIWRASGRQIEVKNAEQHERETAPLYRPEPKGLQIDGWDL